LGSVFLLSRRYALAESRSCAQLSGAVQLPYTAGPPLWDVIYDVSDLIAIRAAALRKHASQVKGNLSLCMIVVYKVYYRRWMEKTNEAFWKEDF
jgi:hypothetical protein